MAEIDAGTIRSSVRLELKKLKADLQTLDTMIKLKSQSMHEFSETTTDYLNQLSERNNKTIAKHLKELTSARNKYIALFKAGAIKGQTKEETEAQRASYKEVIESIDAMIIKAQQYDERSKVLAANRKKRDKEELQAIKEKEQAFKNSMLGQLSAAIKNISIYGAVLKTMRLVGQAMKEMWNVTVQYEQSLANTQSVAQASEKDLRSLDAAARKAGETTRFTASQAAEALYYMASAGFNATESIQALDGTLAMAQATGKSLSDTAEVIATTLAQFNMQAREADRVANSMTAGITSSQATMEKLKTSLYQVGPVASTAGRDLEEVIGVLDVLYDSGMQASRAGRAMRNAIAELSSPTSATVEKLSKMGIAFEDIDVTSNSLADAFGTLADANLDIGQIMSAFGKVIGPQMAVLIRAGRDEIEKYTAEVRDTNKAFLAAHIQNDTMQGDIYRLKSAWEALSITLGREITPIMRSLTQTLFESIRSINTWIKRMAGAHTVANDMYDIIRDLNEEYDEYQRLTSLLGDKNQELTDSEIRLYTARRNVIALNLVDKMNELAQVYPDVLKQEKLLSDAYNVSEQIQRRNERTGELARQLQLAKEQGYTEERKQLIWSTYQEILGMDKQIEQQYVQVIQAGLDKGAGKKLTDVYRQRFTLPVKTIMEEAGVITEKQFTSMEEFFADAANVTGKAYNESFSGFYEMMNVTERALAERESKIAGIVNDINTLASTASETANEGVIQLGRMLAEDESVMSLLAPLSQDLIDAIVAEAEAYKETMGAKQSLIDATYTEIDTFREQLNLTNENIDSLGKYNDSLLDAAIENAKATTNVYLLNQAFDRSKNIVKESTEALREEAEARYQKNLLLIQENENISDLSQRLLSNIAVMSRDNELRAISAFETRQLIQVERERVTALGEATSAELEELEKQQESYSELGKLKTDYASKVVQIEGQIRDEIAKTAYEEAHTVEDFDKAYQLKLEALESSQKEELKVLDEGIAEATQKIQDSIKERQDIIDKGKQEERAKAEELFEQDLNIIEAQKTASTNALFSRLSETMNELALELEERKAKGESAIALEAYEKDRMAEIELQYNLDIRAIDAQRNTSIENAKKTHANVLQSIDARYAERTAQNEADLQKLLTSLDENATFERAQLLAYFGLQQRNADNEREELYQKELLRQTEALEKWEEQINMVQSYIDMLQKQKDAANDARMEELKLLGNYAGAFDLLLQKIAQEEVKALEEAEKEYIERVNALQKLEEEGTITHDRYLSELAELDTDYTNSRLAIETYYRNESNKAGDAYAKDEQTRIASIAQAWKQVTAEFTTYRNALKEQQQEAAEEEVSVLFDANKFKEAREKQRALDEKAKMEDLENLAIHNKELQDEELRKFMQGEQTLDDYKTHMNELYSAYLLEQQAIIDFYANQSAKTDKEYAKAEEEYTKEENEKRIKEEKEAQEELEEAQAKHLEAMNKAQEGFVQKQDGSSKQWRQLREQEVKDWLDFGDLEKSRALQAQLDEEDKQEALDELDAYNKEQKAINKKALEDNVIDKDTYTKNDIALTKAYQDTVAAINEEYRLLALSRDREYDDERERIEEEALDKLTKAQEEHAESLKEIFDTIIKYRDDYKEQLRKQSEDEIDALFEEGEFEKALEIRNRLDAEDKQKTIEALDQHVAKQREVNKKALDDKIITQTEYDAQESRLTTEHMLSLDAINAYYKNLALGHAKEYDEEDIKRQKEAHEKALKAQEEYAKAMQKAMDEVNAYQDPYTDAIRKGREQEIERLMDLAKYKQALALRHQLDEEDKQKTLLQLDAYVTEQQALNLKAYDEGTIDLATFNATYNKLENARLSSATAIEDEYRLLAIERDEEFYEKRKEFVLDFLETTINSAFTLANAFDDAYSSIIDRQIETMQKGYDAQLRIWDAEEEEAMRHAGVLEETAKERLERELEEAVKSGDTQAILDARTALKRQEIQDEYAKKREDAEKEFNWKKAQLEYQASLSTWKIQAMQMLAESAMAIAKAVGSAPFPFNIPAIAFASAMTAAQGIAHANARPVEPQRAEFFEDGGVVRGSKEGTLAYVGEKYKTEYVANADSMANILDAIGRGALVGGTPKLNQTIIFITEDKRELARYTVEDVLNKGLQTIDARKAIRK